MQEEEKRKKMEEEKKEIKSSAIIYTSVVAGRSERQGREAPCVPSGC